MKRLVPMFKTVLPVCFIGLTISGCLPSDGSDDYKLAEKYLHGDGVQVNIQKSIELLQKAADKNYILAINELGKIYLEGDVVPKDLKKSEQYFKKSADEGNSTGEFELGYLYQNFKGEGIPNSLPKSVKYLQKAVDHGDILANKNLGIIYLNLDHDPTIPEDYKKAAQYFQKAAEHGDADSQNILGVMYRDGDGVPKDYNLAEEWFNKAKAQGYPDADVNLQKLNDAKNAPPPLVERGSFSAETFAQQKALHEFESMKQDYPGNPIIGGSISQVSGSAVSYDQNLNCSAVVIKDMDPSKFYGVSKNINFFMDNGSDTVVVINGMGRVTNVQINNRNTDVNGYCNIETGSSISCMISSSDGGLIGGTYANMVHIQAIIRPGAYLSR